MKELRKSQLSVALGAALATMAMVPVTGYGATFDAKKGYYVADDGGDTVIYPAFTAVGNNTTAFSLTNTGARSVAVKVRFREQKNSMDVWDTIVFLSAGDKWDFFVRAGENGVPEVNIDPNDETCTMVPPTPTKPNGFPSPFRKTVKVSDDDWNAGVATVGHVEVIGMMDLTHAVAMYGNFVLSLNAAIEAKNELIPGFANLEGCEALRNVFSTAAGVAEDDVHGLLFAADAPNDLIGRWLINGGDNTGIEAGNEAILIANLFKHPYRAAQSSELCASDIYSWGTSCNERQTAYTWDEMQLDHPHLGDARNWKLRHIDYGLGADWLMGDWSNNPANSVGADWIVSFITRYTHTDFLDCNKADGKEWCYVKGDGTPEDYPSYNPFAKIVSNEDGYPKVPVSCLPAGLWVTDIDERVAQVVASPDDLYGLCNEVNIFTIAKDGEVVRDSLIQQNTGPFARKIQRYETLDAVRGWAEMQLLWPGLQADDGIGAVAGELFILRNTANPDQNNATLSNLQKRTYDYCGEGKKCPVPVSESED